MVVGGLRTSPSVGERVHVDAAAGLEADGAVDQGVEGVVASDADVPALLVLRTALTNEDRAGGDLLATEALDAAELGLESRPLRVEPCPFLCAMGSCVGLAERAPGTSG